jgi:hypothetical protein
MFRKHVHGKIVHLTIAYTEPNKCYTPKPDNEALHSDVVHIPCTPSLVSPSLATASHSTDPVAILMLPNQPPKPTASHFTDPPSESDNDDDDDDGYLANPEPHNEHVGVDDDGLYLLDHKETREGKESESDYESDSESQSDEEYTEEDGLIGADPLPPIPIVAYDKEDPPMRVGSIYNGQNQAMVFSCIHHSLKPLLVEDITRGTKGLQRRGAAQQERKVHINAPFARDMAIAGIIAKMVILKT